MFCYQCGVEIGNGAVFCHRCGVKLPHTGEVRQVAETGKVNDADRQTMSAFCSPGQISVTYNDEEDFKLYVNRYIKKKTLKRSALELMNTHDLFIWICWGILVAFGVFILFTVELEVALGILISGGLVFYLIVYLRNLMLKGKSIGRIPAKTSTNDFIEFLNGHLGYLVPYMHEWGFIKYKDQEKSVGSAAVKGILIGGLRMGMAMANTEALSQSLMQSAVMCAPVGKKRKWLLVIYLKPTKRDKNVLRCSIGIEHRSHGTDPFLSEGPFSDFFGVATHTYLIKLLPLMRATVEYYLKYGIYKL